MRVEALFDEAARDYDRVRRMLVPGFDEFYGAALGSIPFGRKEPIRVLDLGAGTGLLSAMVAEKYPLSRVTLVDLSVEMLRMARRRFGAKITLTPEPGRFEFRVMDFARKPLPGGSGAYDLVVSALAIHHLTHGDKRRVFCQIQDRLGRGGFFVNADQALGPTPEDEQEYQEDWLRRAREAGATARDLTSAQTRMRADKNATMKDQMSWLGEAGFVGVEGYHEDNRFVVYGGRKGEREGERKGEKKEVSHG